jgi:hypothetical protein
MIYLLFWWALVCHPSGADKGDKASTSLTTFPSMAQAAGHATGRLLIGKRFNSINQRPTMSSAGIGSVDTRPWISTRH